MNMHVSAWVLIAMAVVSVGCEEKKPQPPLKAPESTGGPARTAPPPNPHAGVQGGPSTPQPAPTAPQPGAQDQVVTVLGVSVPLPAAWVRKPPANQMRLAEAVIPGPGGDAAKNCTVVFSTAGGSIDDNIARWSGQVRDASGQPVKGTQEATTVNGVRVTTVQMNGSFTGMGDAAAKDNWTLRGAIIEAPEGLLFIKVTGPAEAMTAADESFKALVGGVKKS